MQQAKKDSTTKLVTIMYSGHGQTVKNSSTIAHFYYWSIQFLVVNGSQKTKIKEIFKQNKIADKHVHEQTTRNGMVKQRNLSAWLVPVTLLWHAWSPFPFPTFPSEWNDNKTKNYKLECKKIHTYKWSCNVQNAE